MLRKIWRNPQAVIGLGLIVLICAVAILAPLLAPHAPDEVNPLMKYQAPSADYPLEPISLGGVNYPACFMVQEHPLGWRFPF